MTPTQPTSPSPARTDPFRWDPLDAAQACDHFRDPDHPSQRQYAQQHGIPRSTLGYWLRQADDQPDDQPDADNAALAPEARAFFRSAAGELFLRRLVLALFLVFLFGGACGLRCLALFLRRTGLDHFVAPSLGALHALGQTIQAELGTFADEERPRLAAGMEHRHIAVIPDENFHGNHICLVAAEAASGFLLVEQYADSRDADTWTAAFQQGLADLPVTVLLVSGDQAKGIIACAQHGLEARHLPELFHGCRDLCGPLLRPLFRQKEAAEKELQQAQEQVQACCHAAEQAASGRRRPGRPKDHRRHIGHAETAVLQGNQKVQECCLRQEQALQAVRGLADDFHPFDSQTGAAVEEMAMQERLEQRLQTLEEVQQEAALGAKAEEALARGQRWVESLVAALAWFWGVARILVEELELPAEVEQQVYAQLLPGLYWQEAAGRGRTAAERHQQEELAERLLRAAWAAGGGLSQLGAEQRAAVLRVSQEVVGLFARSSSSVEGRNGRLSLFRHGHTRLSAERLQALTTIHNYLNERADGTTAAERFFGTKPRDLFDWLLERMPALPRPAAKRPKKATPATAKAG
jgi:hypothetical protein